MLKLRTVFEEAGFEGGDKHAIKCIIRKNVMDAISRDKAKGTGLLLGGSPISGIHFEWPLEDAPPYPAIGVWHKGVYCGDDG